jgi:hypothetical protein
VADLDFASAFKPLYDDLVNSEVTALTVSDAVEKALAFQGREDLVVPRIYFSTAITSGGFFRDKSLSLPEVIARNGRTAQLVVSALVEYRAPSVSPKDMMLPTELGKVPGWADSHYLLFYFCWLSGLSRSGTAWVENELKDPVYRPILEIANDRGKSNDDRWPSYRTFVEVLLAKLALAEARPDAMQDDGCQLLLQLVDVEYSLGCRAEQIYAEARGLDRLAPTFSPDVASALGQEIAALKGLGSTVGAERKPVELVPVQLRK